MRSGLTSRRARVRPGYTRTSGFYGKYNVPGSELKFFETQVDNGVAATNGVISEASICLIPQGVTESQRVGRKCTITQILWRWNVILPETDAVATPANADVFRMIMYLDKQCNGAAATAALILESPTFQAYNNLENSQRFRILYDKSVTINYTGGLASDNAGVVSQPQQLRSGAFYKKCNIPIEYSSTTGAITEIRSNNVGILLISKNAIATLVSQVRVRFAG